jgi:hypothetical protein
MSPCIGKGGKRTVCCSYWEKCERRGSYEIDHSRKKKVIKRKRDEEINRVDKKLVNVREREHLHPPSHPSI